MVRFLVVALGVLAIVSPARAEVPSAPVAAFNEAIGSGDQAAMADAASALGEAALKHAGDPQAALLAFEAAWVLCQLGACEEAMAYADFAAGQPAGEGHPTAVSRAMLAAYAAWQAAPGKDTRAALDAALADAVDSEPTAVSLVVFSKRYVADITEQDYERAIDSAGDAARHLEPARDIVGEAWSDAALSAAVSRFNHDRSDAAQEALTHLRGQLAELYLAHRKSDDPAHKWIRDRYYTAEAWGAALAAYYNSTRRRDGLGEDAMDAILAGYGATREQMNAVFDAASERDGLPFCEGKLVTVPAVAFPRIGGRDPQFGAVIVGYEFAEGAVENVEVLASVPVGGFERDVIAAVSNWHWKPDRDQPVEPCSLSRGNIVQTFIFQLGD